MNFLMKKKKYQNQNKNIHIKYMTKIKGCPAGMSFSECRKQLNKKKNKEEWNKISLQKEIPPKGVIIRKGNKYFKSNGVRLQPFINK